MRTSTTGCVGRTATRPSSSRAATQRSTGARRGAEETARAAPFAPSSSRRGAPTPPPPWGRRRALLVLLGAAATAIGIALLIGRAAGYAKLLDSLRGAKAEWLALGLPAEACAYLGYTLAFRGSTRLGGGPAFGFALSWRLVLASLGATRIMLGGGPGLVYWALRMAGLSRSGALARLVALNVLLFGAFAAAAWLSALLLEAGIAGSAPRSMTLPWLIGVAAAAAAALGGLAGSRFSPRAQRTLALAGQHLRVTAGSLAAFAGALLFWSGDVLCLWAGLRAFSVHVPVAALFLAYATSYLATMLPLSLGGVGGAEAAMALSLAAVGVPLAPALLGVLAYRLFSFWLPTIPGLAVLATVPWLSRDLRGGSGGPAIP